MADNGNNDGQRRGANDDNVNDDNMNVDNVNIANLALGEDQAGAPGNNDDDQREGGSGSDGEGEGSDAGQPDPPSDNDQNDQPGGQGRPNQNVGQRNGQGRRRRRGARNNPPNPNQPINRPAPGGQGGQQQVAINRGAAPPNQQNPGPANPRGPPQQNRLARYLPDARGIILSGPCENINFYRDALGANPMLSGLMLRNLEHYPFVEPWDYTLITTMAIIAEGARSILLGRYPCEESLLFAVVVAELLGPCLHEDFFLNEANSQDTYIRSAEALRTHNNMMRRVCPQFQVATYDADAANDQSFIRHRDYIACFGHPVVGEFNQRIETIEAATRFFAYVANKSNPVVRKDNLTLIVHATVAVCKRGTITQKFADKIQNGIRDDIQQEVEIDVESITTFYKNFGKSISDDDIEGVMGRWNALLPNQALRLSLTIQQIAGSGLTAYMTIGKAMASYVDFNWAAISRAYPGEWRSFQAAIAAVGDNQYYGFRHDLGPAKSTLYKSLGYVAKELLVKVGGMTSLNYYRGWATRVAHQLIVDQMILDFAAARGEQDVQPANREFGDDDDDIPDEIVADNRLRAFFLS